MPVVRKDLIVNVWFIFTKVECLKQKRLAIKLTFFIRDYLGIYFAGTVKPGVNTDTRRFSARPSAVLLVAIGADSP